ncbi:tRNA threonylcarbamoyladenosine dehydratase [Robbsia sp. Bb-Pol-6]|uniref:tRNA threonylcarbamoyladenosine dehydratase n=1 Tax=Robbsia betulipollinis TaxID=2981849 RepID=A0ABT3ZMH7_9BURK|nr:tRNA threonylcarbamoyladenosine dehydratase [Robbsia betulipollinis]MCY0387672.1 tRNA threonylcarbamoyladenosine dehydratase [Robbsia betulipollinis]
MNLPAAPVDVASSAHAAQHEAQHEAPDRARRFGGVARLYGAPALRRFAAAHVVVIGIGGVGSWAAEALARTAVGRLTLVDLDHVAESNTNRQLHALDGNYGKAKITAMAERIRLIDPDCRVDEIDDFIGPENFETVLGSGCDYVIDAIDDTRTKTALIAWCAARGLNIVTIGGAGGQLDPTRIRIEDLSRTIQDPLLAKVRQQLRRQHGFPRSPKTRFGIAAVYSDEPLRYPDAAGPGAEACAIGEPAAPGAEDQGAALPMGGPAGLNCAGFGSSVCVTASFGLAAAAHVLRVLADAS